MPTARRHPQDPADRLRADRDRPGGRVRLLGHAGGRVLMQEGYEVVLVNSNPATIMTDPEVATTTYVEPLLPGPVEQIIERERPDALLRDARRPDRAQPRQGAARERRARALRGRADRRQLRRDRPRRGPRAVPRDDARGRAAGAALGDRPHARGGYAAAVAEIGLPVIVRPAFTLGGAGGGVAARRWTSSRR